MNVQLRIKNTDMVIKLYLYMLEEIMSFNIIINKKNNFLCNNFFLIINMTFFLPDGAT